MWETAITANYSSGREEDPTTPKYPIPPFQKRSSGSGSWFFFSSNGGGYFSSGETRRGLESLLFAHGVYFSGDFALAAVAIISLAFCQQKATPFFRIMTGPVCPQSRTGKTFTNPLPT